MIHAPAGAAGGAARLLDAMRARGVAFLTEDAPVPEDGATLVLTTPVDWMALGVQMAPWRVARGARIVVLSRVGAHPDAVAPGLRDLWRLEEYARVSLVPTLTLRFGPLVGKDTPFWRKLASRPPLAKHADAVIMPVLEEDAIEALARALAEKRPAEGWFEIVGPEARTLAEWAGLAAGSASGDAGAWEPDLEELDEHRLSEAGLWQERFAIRTRPVSAWAAKA